MTDAELSRGTEVVITGPNIWGQHIRQGNRGVVVGFAFGGIKIRLHQDDSTITYPDSSLKAWTGETEEDE